MGGSAGAGDDPIGEARLLAVALRIGRRRISLAGASTLSSATNMVGVAADRVRAGHMSHIALSETAAATIRRAHAVDPITAVQLECSRMSRSLEEVP